MAVFTLFSPSENIKLHIILKDGCLFYETFCEDTPLCSTAPLGIIMEKQNLTYGFTHISIQKGHIDDTYVIPAFKKASCRDHCNTLTLRFENKEGELCVEARAYDDGAALRLIVPGEGPSAVLSEKTGFSVPQTAKQVIGMKEIFSYEDHYLPIPVEDLWQNRLAMPVLIEAGQAKWALYTEAAVFGDYGGSHVLSSPEAPGLLMIQKAEDKLTPITNHYPVQTPWRVVMGGSLAAITNSNLLENLNPPSIVEDTSFIRSGLSGWSWMVENDSVFDAQRNRQYIDYSAKMGFPFYLADYLCAVSMDIPALVQYAKDRNIDLWIWDHRADISDPAVADEKMRKWASWGIVGIKIDFFESDGAECIAVYDMLARTAAKYRLMLNYHGATKPSGERRTWPHVMTREGVQGGEYLQNYSTFTPMGPDATHNCTLPFTRNAIGPMDYTPFIYKTYLTGTSDTHQAALLVIFLSYVQHVGERGEYVLESPLRDLISSLPASWDEGQLLEGSPGNYVTFARRHGDCWFVAGICARRPRSAQFDVSFLEEGTYSATLYADDLSDMNSFDVSMGALPPADEAICEKVAAFRERPSLHKHNMHLIQRKEMQISNCDRMSIPMTANGGFVLQIHPKR